jgi:hypothetical protein
MGSTILENMGWTEKTKAALKKIAKVNTGAAADFTITDRRIAPSKTISVIVVPPFWHKGQ